MAAILHQHGKPEHRTRAFVKNTHIIGKPGTGKTATLNRFCLDDIYDGKGVAYFGRSAHFILSHIPRKHWSRTVLFDPSDTEYPIGFNPLVDPDGSVEMMKNLFGVEIVAPNMSLYFSASIRAIPEKTIPNIARMLLDQEYRNSLTIKNTDLAAFWKWYSKLTERERATKIDSTLNKVYSFLTDEVIRNIVAQKPKIDLYDLSDKILIVPLNKRPLSGDKLSMFASMVISAMHQAGYNGTFYLDDVHRLAPRVVYTLLDDRASLVAAHQYLSQLGRPYEEPREAFLGLATRTIAFRLSATDAKELREQFAIRDGDNTLHDALELLPRFTAHVITADGLRPQQPMPETARPPIPGAIDAIQRRSRPLYARPRHKVEAVLNARKAGRV